MNILNEIELEVLHNQEESTFGKIKNVLFFTIVALILNNLVLFLYKTFIPEYSSIEMSYQFWGGTSTIHRFISTCILAPFIEEIIFRLGPLELAKYTNNGRIMLLTILLSSAIFGIMHSEGKWSVPIQGVGGLILCYVYLKNGYSYLSAVTLHFFVNLFYFLK